MTIPVYDTVIWTIRAPGVIGGPPAETRTLVENANSLKPP